MALAAAFHPERLRTVRRGIPARGFTLVESLMASSILLGIVVAVTSAIISGQQHAYEAQQRVAAGIAAEALLGRIVALDNAADITAWNSHREEPGEMIDEHGNPMPPMFDGLGREVETAAESRVLKSPDITVAGQIVRVSVFDAYGRVLAVIERFVVESTS